MTYKENITAILECYFTGFKEEIIDSACNRILEQEPCEVSEYDKDHIWYKGHQYISLRRFLEVKAEAEQEPKTGHWISISGTPPEDTGYYLTTTIYGDVYCDYWTGSRFDRQETVIAWMPLPQPYKAEGSENEK